MCPAGSARSTSMCTSVEAPSVTMVTHVSQGGSEGAYGSIQALLWQRVMQCLRHPAQAARLLTPLKPITDQVLSCQVMRRRRGPQAHVHSPDRAQLPVMVPRLLWPQALVHACHSLMRGIACQTTLATRRQAPALSAERAFAPSFAACLSADQHPVQGLLCRPFGS